MYVLRNYIFSGSLHRREAISRLRGKEIPRTDSETISRSRSDLQTCNSLYIVQRQRVVDLTIIRHCL